MTNTNMEQKKIASENGDVLLPSGIVLKKSYLDKHKYSNRIDDIECRETPPFYDADHPSMDILSTTTRKNAYRLIKGIFKAVAMYKRLNIKPIRASVTAIIEDISDKRGKNKLIPLLIFTENDTCTHSINVCALSVICGMMLELSNSDLERLGIAAILHDVGKAFIPEEILKKPGELSQAEFKIIESHTSLGFAFLQRHPDIDEQIAKTAFLHHERADGSGYPLGLKLENLDVFSRIVAITDIYDAITSDRSYRPGINSCHALEYLISYGFHFLDYSIVRAFADNISIYPDGVNVILETGERAQVIAQNTGMPSRPIIRILTDESGQPLTQYRLVDMLEMTDVIIKNIMVPTT
jgi:HD-GYP domain-containing protein (c-di-GMP phosphodiesterase class II)